jgi:hypothetical protein
MGYYVKNRRTPSGSSSIVIPSGGTAVRPASPTFGSFRYNTDLGQMEFFNGTVFTQLQSGDSNLSVDSFTGDGSTLTFSMSVSADDAEQVIVFVGSVYQQPTTAYSITGGGNDITFTGAPPDGEPINVIHGLAN